MPASIFHSAWREQQTAVFAWAVIGLIALAAGAAWLGAGLPGTAALAAGHPRGQAALEPDAFALLTHLLLASFAVVRGAQVLPDPRRRSDLELLLVRPVTRWRAVGQRFAALILALGLLGGLYWLGGLLASRLALSAFSAGVLGGLALALTVLAASTAAVVLAVASLTGRPLLAGLAGGLVWLLAWTLPLAAVRSPELGWAARLSPLSAGFRLAAEPQALLWLALPGLAAVVLGLFFYERRDLTE